MAKELRMNAHLYRFLILRAKLEKTLRFLEEGGMRKISGTGKTPMKFEKYENKSDVKTYQPAADSTIPVKSEEEMEKKKKKRKVRQFLRKQIVFTSSHL